MNRPLPSNELDYAIVTSLRAMLDARGMVAPASFDETLARGAPADADDLLGRLQVAGHLTEMQAETLRDAFRTEQNQTIYGALQAAVQRGMLSPSYAEQAYAEFQGVLTWQRPPQFLVAAQYLTPEQAGWLFSPTPSVSASPAGHAYPGFNHPAPAPLWQPASFQSSPPPPPPVTYGAPSPFVTAAPNGRREFEALIPLVCGPVAMIVAVSTTAILAEASSGQKSSWLLLLLPALSLGVLLWAVAGRPWAERLKWVALTLGVLPFAGYGAARLFVSEPVMTLRPDCTMAGTGRGDCVFTNVTSHPGEGCGSVTATCTLPNGTRESRDSETICSGLVGSGHTRRMSFSVAEFDRVRARATPFDGDWRDHCEFSWNRQ